MNRQRTTRVHLTGAAFAAGAIFMQSKYMGIATLLLSFGLVIAYGLWVTVRGRAETTTIIPTYLAGVAIQCLHFGEEYITGFQREFPALFGYTWSDRQFVAFNLIWLSVFIFSAIGVYLRYRLAYLIVFFFALAGGIGNGLGHLALSLAQQRYFPGTFTAPICLAIGVLLFGRLVRNFDVGGSEQKLENPTKRIMPGFWWQM